MNHGCATVESWLCEVFRTAVRRKLSPRQVALVPREILGSAREMSAVGTRDSWLAARNAPLRPESCSATPESRSPTPRESLRRAEIAPARRWNLLCWGVMLWLFACRMRGVVGALQRYGSHVCADTYNFSARACTCERFFVILRRESESADSMTQSVRFCLQKFAICDRKCV